ncbi:MAG: hypothetical protein ACREJC_08305 [Tepidisphaeraceae bacterium]
MLRISLIAVLMLSLGVRALAQPQALPPDLIGLPDEIKTLQWKSIDMGSVPVLEHCRALLLLNHVLDELSANSTAEADLMSSYIETQNLGAQFANTPPPPSPSQLGYADVEKVAVAMLRGPMSSSYYSTELSDVSPSGLASYAQMYERTCQRRWSEFDESRHLVRCMTSFLGNNQKLQDYDGWATAEAARREAAYQQRNPGGAQQNSAGQQQAQAQLQQTQQQLQQVQGALGAAEYQQQALAQQTAQAQQAAAQAQQQAAQAQQQTADAQQTYPPGYVAPVYGGYGGYGYGAYGTAGAAAAGAYAGANAANSAAANPAHPNATPAAAAAAGQYHGANSSWSHDASHNSAARSQTEQRMSSFHGAGGARGGAGRR